METKLDVKKTVKKSNILNELRDANASPVIYRLFCVYLAHLKMDGDDNVVTFTLSDYARISGLDRPRYVDLKMQAKNLVATTAALTNEDGGFSVYSLFSEFKLYQDEKTNEWMVSLECNPKIMPLIREQKGYFLRYKLYNTIYLKSYNHQRMYEILKQYERVGERTIDLNDLRSYLSITKNEYAVWGDFSQKVLKTSQKALKDGTDICFDYEPVKKGRKVVSVRFKVYKNNAFSDKIMIDKFDGEEIVATYAEDEIVVRPEIDEENRIKRENLCVGLEDEIFDEFTLEQLTELAELANKHITPEMVNVHAEYVDVATARGYAKSEYIRAKILKANATQNVTNRYAYIKAAVANNYA